MAETRKITIEILSSTSTGGEQSKPPKEKKQRDETKEFLSIAFHPIKSIEDATVNRNVWIKMAYNSSKQLIGQALSTGLNAYFNISEDYLTQQVCNNIQRTISLGSSMASSVESGVMVGAAFGPVGALIGGTLGFATGAVNAQINYNARMSGYYSALNATNYGTQFSRTRAGLTNNGRGTEN